MSSTNPERFDVSIVHPQLYVVTKGGFKYHSLPHGAEYKIRLVSFHDTDADARITMDGEHIGTFRLRPRANLEIERPSTIARSFTLLKENSTEGKEAGVTAGKSSNGVIMVEFKPEYKPSPFAVVEQCYKSRGGARGFSFGTGGSRGVSFGTAGSSSTPGIHAYGSGGTFGMDGRSLPTLGTSSSGPTAQSLTTGFTALGKESNQRFTNVAAIVEVDEQYRCTVVLRLVVDERPLESQQKPFVAVDKAVAVNPPPRVD